MSELRGATLGIVGYGDIGRASAKLAKAYGMRVLGLKRNIVVLSSDDPYRDRFYYGPEGLGEVMAESDYVLVATPLTEATRGVVSAEMLGRCKSLAVIINVGRGPCFRQVGTRELPLGIILLTLDIFETRFKPPLSPFHHFSAMLLL